MNFIRKKTKDLPDQELLEQFIESRDLDTLGILFSRYMHLVYGVCLKYIGEREEAKDTVNRIFERLITEVPKYDIQEFRPWLFVMTKNHCLMKIRKGKSEENRFEKYSQEFRVENTEELHPIDEASKEQMERGLQQCIEALKEEQQICIRAFYYEDKAYQEIAELHNIDIKKVKSHIQNARRNLKICIEQLQLGYEV